MKRPVSYSFEYFDNQAKLIYFPLNRVIQKNNMIKSTFTFILVFFCFHFLQAQQTVGLFTNTPEAFDGYTLFSPTVSTTTYLIDNCGELVHSWTGSPMSGASVYLTEEGHLYRKGKSTGNPGFLEVLDWNSNILWTYSSSPDYGNQHHDIEILPNGNILLIVQDERSQAEVEQAGGILSTNGTISEKIIEVQPDFANGLGTVIWEWEAWDHLVQDVDPDKPNYAVVADSPERIDINFTMQNSDWLHVNGIDYNANLDQIVISVPRFNEIWIIDHSTSTIQASGSVGGNAGKGGDLLYRWGNPEAYDQGTINDQKLFFQHHPNWIPDGYPDAGKIIIFNNRYGEVLGQQFSSIDVIQPPLNADGTYLYSGIAYSPEDTDWTYQASPPTSFFSNIISGAERLENGNTLICEGTGGRFIEVDLDGNTVWEYVNPVQSNGIVEQYETATMNNVFRVLRYAPDYAGLAGQDLTPQGYIEPGSNFTCTLFTSNEDIQDEKMNIQLFPNPVANELSISVELDQYQVEIINIAGRVCRRINASNTLQSIDISSLPSGMYLAKVSSLSNDYFECLKFIKK